MSGTKKLVAIPKKTQSAGPKPAPKTVIGVKRQLLTKNEFTPPFPKSKRLQIGTALAGRDKQRVGSGRRFLLYDKALQLYEVRGVMVEQARTRIEVKYSAQKCGRSSSVEDVLCSENPLLKLQLASCHCDQVVEPALEFFLLGVREWGFNAALKKIGDHNKRSALRQAIGTKQVDWWQPERVWKEVLSHLASLNLFPKSAFKHLGI